MPDHFGNNQFKFGLFSANCGGGLTFSAAPDRWPAEWDELAEVARMADQAGIEFILPVAKWRGIGEADNFGRSFETLTHSAALAGITKRIGLFATVHVSLLTAAFAAKAIATIDHASHGRAGLNIVCGWNPDEFSLHGITIDGERRYDQGLEWFRIWAKLLAGGPRFDWEGEFYQLRGVMTDPLSVQRPHPPVMSAGFSRKGRDFAAQCADILFSTLPDLDQAAQIVADVQARAASYGRQVAVYSQTLMVCRPTRREADEFFHYVAEEQADPTAIAYFRRQRLATAGSDTPASERPIQATHADPRLSAPGLFPGTYPLIGTPDDVVAELSKLHRAGLAGSALVFFNYLKEFPFFADEVLPRMVRAGLREEAPALPA
jgi:FMNH2-dependent dimethyl sulfone monooxygenase